MSKDKKSKKERTYTFSEVVEKSPLKRETINKRFYGPKFKKWGVKWRKVTRREKVVSEENFEKFFTKSRKGMRG